MTTDINEKDKLQLTRRTFLGKTVRSVGSLALASLLTPSIINAAPEIEKWHGLVTTPHVTPKAKTIIHLCMAGGPSHLETLDYKTELAESRSTDASRSRTDTPIANLQASANDHKCLGPTHEFQKFGNPDRR